MADVTISQLSQGTPVGNNILPYSTGSNTLGVPVSAIFHNVDKIGIGYSSPQATLEISVNNLDRFAFYGSNDNTLAIQTLLDGQHLNTYGTYGGNENRLILQPLVGNVGIGTTAPAAKLDVNGTIKATGLQVPGTILNIVQAVYNDESDVGTGPQGAGNSWTDVPGLTVSITPKFASSKFMLRANIHSVFNATTTCNFRFLKNGAPIGVGKAGVAANGTTPDDLGSFRGSTPNPSWCNPAMGEFLDTSSNTGAAITYKVQFKPYYFDNRTLRWNNSIAGGGGDRVRVISTLTVTEIAG